MTGMERLTPENINTAEEYERIFNDRSAKEADWADQRRWDTLLLNYQGGRLIDLGCLDSEVAPRAKAKAPCSDVYGLDFVQAVIDRRSRENPEVHWVRGDVYGTGYRDGYFDYAVLGEVIEHLENPKAAVDEAARIVRSGGTIALSTPLEEIIEPGAVDGDRHLWSFSEEDIRNLLDPHGEVEVMVLRS
jgi:SAM-dependent methyltransferase